MNFNSLKEKCNYYRDLTDYKILPNSYVLVMVDGRGFSKLIKNKFEKPFDDKFIYMMNESAKYVCENVCGCKFAYTQSDEASFVLTDFDNDKTDSFYKYRLCKMNSIIASLMTSKFNQLMTLEIMNTPASDTDKIEMIKNMKLAQFDCKTWSVPCYNDAFAWFLYRQIDCVRNSKSAVAQYCCSPNELKNKNTDEQIALAKERGFDWVTIDQGKKYGRFIYRKEINTGKDDVMRNKWFVQSAFPLMGVGGREAFDEIGIKIKRD